MAGKPPEVDYTLENLLDYHGRTYWFNCGWWLKFEVQQVEPTEGVPHGVKYSLTLHDEYGTRMMGHDNAHAITAKKGMRKKYLARWDHVHRDETDPGQPYDYVDGATLLKDFFAAVDVFLKGHDHEHELTSEGEGR